MGTLSDSMKLELHHLGIKPDGILYRGRFSHVIKGKFQGKLVAIKCLLSADNKKRALRERNILRKVQNDDNVVRIMEPMVTTNCEEYALLLEYCQSGNLNDSVTGQPRNMYEDLWRSFVFDMLKAVAYIHGEGIVHLKIQPSKFLVGLLPSGMLCLKLAGFSCAQITNGAHDDDEGLDEGFDEHELSSFSPPTNRRDTTDDVYSLAATIYEHSCTGKQLQAKHDGKPLRECDEAALGRYIRDSLTDDTTIQRVVTDGLIINARSRTTAREMLNRLHTQPTGRGTEVRRGLDNQQNRDNQHVSFLQSLWDLIRSLFSRT